MMSSQQQRRDYGTITPSSSSSNTNITGNPTATRVNIIRNRFYNHCDGNEEEAAEEGDQEEEDGDAVGQYGYENDHTAGCDKRWIRMQSSRGECRRCSNDGRLHEDNMGEEEADGAEDDSRPHVKGSQRWRNVKAVMAYYYALRKIKRNVAFVYEAFHSITGVAFDGVVLLVYMSTTTMYSGLVVVSVVFILSNY